MLSVLFLSKINSRHSAWWKQPPVDMGTCVAYRICVTMESWIGVFTISENWEVYELHFPSQMYMTPKMHNAFWSYQ
jgi:hypothetical protein